MEVTSRYLWQNTIQLGSKSKALAARREGLAVFIRLLSPGEALKTLQNTHFNQRCALITGWCGVCGKLEISIFSLTLLSPHPKP